ncbi:MAG TPA: LysR family transcriptional regulator [Cellvibrio sp.]|nr:LysR family transcriptional regulator [Cellvibrio sp.]
MENLRGIDSFVKTVDAGSIAAAARLLGISAAAASQNITRLENQLGARLLTRTTRSLRLTEAGELYYSKVRHIIHELELANSAVSELSGEPQGRLRIASTAAFGRHVLAALLPEFNATYPRVSVEILTTDRNVDHVRDAVDVSIRFKQQLEDGMVARRIANIPFLYCASPAYLARMGRPKSPDDLAGHAGLMFRMPTTGKIYHWRFARNGVAFDAKIRVATVSDDIDVLARLAANGAGIARLGDFIARRYVERGELEVLFESCQTAGIARAIPEPLELFIVLRDRHELTPKVRAFTEFLINALPPQWQVKSLGE